jgi:hypothetical protein
VKGSRPCAPHEPPNHRRLLIPERGKALLESDEKGPQVISKRFSDERMMDEKPVRAFLARLGH